MQSRCFGFLIFVTLFVTCAAWGQVIQSAPAQNSPAQPVPQSAPQSGHTGGGDFSDVTNPDPTKVVPKDTIIVKGAWSSASDSTTPLPEGSAVTNNVFTSRYFGIAYPRPPTGCKNSRLRPRQRPGITSWHRSGGQTPIKARTKAVSSLRPMTCFLRPSPRPMRGSS